MNNSNLADQVTPIVKQLIAEEADVLTSMIKSEDHLNHDLDLDSLSVACICVEIEKQYQITIPESAIEQVETVQDLISITKVELEKKYNTPPSI